MGMNADKLTDRENGLLQIIAKLMDDIGKLRTQLLTPNKDS